MKSNKAFWVYTGIVFVFSVCIVSLGSSAPALNFFVAAISNTSVNISGTPVPVCNTDADCGVNGFTGAPFCQDGNVYQNYITYTCNNPGTLSSSCSDATA